MGRQQNETPLTKDQMKTNSKSYDLTKKWNTFNIQKVQEEREKRTRDEKTV